MSGSTAQCDCETMENFDDCTFEPIRRCRDGLMPVASSSGARKARHRRTPPSRSRFDGMHRRYFKSRRRLR